MPDKNRVESNGYFLQSRSYGPYAVQVVSFAIACYKSEEHRWWFTPHPPLPLNTRLVPPRLLVPVGKRDRDDKRPIVKYTEILNQLTDEEWSLLDLPPPSSISHRHNLQLPDLVDPVLGPLRLVPMFFPSAAFQK